MNVRQEDRDFKILFRSIADVRRSFEGYEIFESKKEKLQPRKLTGVSEFKRKLALSSENVNKKGLTEEMEYEKY